MYDVAIVGGGLAGLSLSIQLAQRGYQVALLEKQIYPFHKVCGEYISMESWAFLERIGVPLSNWGLPIMKKINITDLKGKPYQFDLPLGGFGVSRYKLDETLYQIALQKGVQIFTNTKVAHINYTNDQFIIQSLDETITAKVAVGSFGKRSNMDIQWNRSFTRQKATPLKNYIGVKYHIYYPHITDIIALHNFHSGYCGISKIEDDKCCLCYLTIADNVKKNNNSISQMEQQVLYKNPQLKKIFTTADFLYNQPLTISQISFDKKTQIENHVLMIGDAGGMITPLSGNGMSMAMHGSKLACEVINAFLQQTIDRAEMERRYIINWNKQFTRRLYMGRIVQKLSGKKNTTAILLKAMKTFPGLANYVISSTHGEQF